MVRSLTTELTSRAASGRPLALHDRPIRLDVLAQNDPAAAYPHKVTEHRLSIDQRKRPKVRTVQFEQVERVQDHVAVAPAGMQLVEQGQAGLGAEYDRLAVDRCGSRP